MTRRAAIVSCLVMGLAGGCAPTVVTSTPGASAPPAVAAPLAVAPVIAKLDVPSKRTIGAELLEVRYDVTTKGSGLLSKYGLKSRLGSQVFPLKQAIPVIDGGHVVMPQVGPLPNITEGGELDVEFWVIDSAGLESNHLSFKITVQ